MAEAPKYTERELVEGCVRNDRRCQEYLYRQYFQSMMRMCMRYTQDKELAMEIVNSGFSKGVQKIAHLQIQRLLGRVDPKTGVSQFV
jgi:DNA-directed RNA polymerase specialized sigma24 family protein